MFNKIFSTPKLIRAMFTGSLLLILIGFIVIAVFLYGNFYKLILQTEEIVIIQMEALLEPIKTNLLDQVLKNLAIKSQGGVIEVEKLKNPFK